MTPDTMFTDSKGRSIKSPSDGVKYYDDPQVRETAQFVSMFMHMCKQEEPAVVG